MRSGAFRLGAFALGLAMLLPNASSVRAATDERAQAAGAARAFLDDYVTADGRVVRHDQGGDTVSEGQAYAMLLAVAARDRARFARVWSWTVANLQRPDGLLAWRWADGRVVDWMPASDADLDAARALVVAADTFSVPEYRSDATRIADAVMANETVDVAGRPVLVAGPWARGESGASISGIINPSYFSPRTYDELLRSSGDRGWSLLAATGRDEVAQLTRSSLPPDWATVAGDGVARPSSSPGGDPAGYRQDAARLPVRYAEACDASSRSLSVALWPRLQYAQHRSAIGLIGAAGAADAAGQLRARDRLFARAEETESRFPTYYGAAWVALARAMLTTRLLRAC